MQKLIKCTLLHPGSRIKLNSVIFIIFWLYINGKKLCWRICRSLDGKTKILFLVTKKRRTNNLFPFNILNLIVCR